MTEKAAIMALRARPPVNMQQNHTALESMDCQVKTLPAVPTPVHDSDNTLYLTENIGAARYVQHPPRLRVPFAPEHHESPPRKRRRVSEEVNGGEDELAQDGAPHVVDADRPAPPVTPVKARSRSTRVVRQRRTPLPVTSRRATRSRPGPPSSLDMLAHSQDRAKAQPEPEPESESQQPELVEVEPQPASDKPKSEKQDLGRSRRNPKRKASSISDAAYAGDDGPADVSGNLLEKALETMTNEEIEQWQGWIELESDPAFMEAIIRKWGVKDTRIEEVFCMDEAFLNTLPKPVYGLVFLFEYVGDGPEHEEQEVDTSKVWFANQTTDNACASVALLNILMNADIDLGDTLRQFKAETENLSMPMRGYVLSTNTAIRSAHNYLTSKMDHLNADLYLDNLASEAASRRSPKDKRRNTRTKSKGGKKKHSTDAAYHFIGYVPSGGHVWELDGLVPQPVCLGPIPGQNGHGSEGEGEGEGEGSSGDDGMGGRDDGLRGRNDNMGRRDDDLGGWLSVAASRLQARVAQYDASVCFNLLALCRSPLLSLPETMARSIKSLRVIDQRMRSSGDPDWSNLIPTDEFEGGVPISFCDPKTLEALGGLTPADIDAAEVLHDQLKDGGGGGSSSNGDGAHNGNSDTATTLTIGDAHRIHEELVATLRSARAEYLTRVSVVQETIDRVEARKQNWMPAIHEWLKALAEKGVLEELIAESKAQRN